MCVSSVYAAFVGQRDAVYCEPNDRNGDAGPSEAGCDADLLLLDLDAMSADLVAPDVPELELLLARAGKSHMPDMIIARKDVVRDGKHATLDLTTLEARVAVALPARYRDDGRLVSCDARDRASLPNRLAARAAFSRVGAQRMLPAL